MQHHWGIKNVIKTSLQIDSDLRPTNYGDIYFL
jgi:hypothetical protein